MWQFQAVGCPASVLRPPLSAHDLLSTQGHTPRLLKLQRHTGTLTHTGVCVIPYVFMDTHSQGLTHSAHTLHLHSRRTPLCPTFHASHNYRLKHTHTCRHPVCLCLQAPTRFRHMHRPFPHCTPMHTSSLAPLATGTVLVHAVRSFPDEI